MEQSFDSNYILIVLGVIALVIEVALGAVTGFDLLLLGIIFIISGGVGLMLQSFPIALGLVAILSLLYVVIGRRFVKNKLTIATHPTNVDRLMGKPAIVVKKITDDVPGQVKVDGEVWRADSDKTFAVGEKVIIQSVRGVTLTVGS